jgi:hypothetical protein
VILITGATGANVGRVVMKARTTRGHEVRRVARSAGVSIDDAIALGRAFSGADGAFLMIPFDMTAPDLHHRENEIGTRLAEAVRTGGTRRVVLLSGTSAHLKRGRVLGAAMMEERLDAMAIAVRTAALIPVEPDAIVVVPHDGRDAVTLNSLDDLVRKGCIAHQISQAVRCPAT